MFGTSENFPSFGSMEEWIHYYGIEAPNRRGDGEIQVGGKQLWVCREYTDCKLTHLVVRSYSTDFFRVDVRTYQVEILKDNFVSTTTMIHVNNVFDWVVSVTFVRTLPEYDGSPAGVMFSDGHRKYPITPGMVIDHRGDIISVPKSAKVTKSKCDRKSLSPGMKANKILRAAARPLLNMRALCPELIQACRDKVVNGEVDDKLTHQDMYEAAVRGESPAPNDIPYLFVPREGYYDKYSDFEKMLKYHYNLWKRDHEKFHVTDVTKEVYRDFWKTGKENFV